MLGRHYWRGALRAYGNQPWSWVALTVVAVGMFVTIIMPLYSMLIKSVQDRTGAFIGMGNFAEYLQNPALFNSIFNSLFVAVSATVIAVVLAFLYAYALTRTRIPGKNVFGAIAIIPLLSPSLLQAISLIYLFGNQGIINEVLQGRSIYGPIGIIAGLSMWSFPMALIIIKASMSASDGRLYESAISMRTGAVRVFFTITLPGVKYGLISSLFVIFTLTFTDFGVAKVIGGNYQVLSTDLFKQVIGQQNFQMGAVVGLMLLLPAVLSFLVDRHAQRKQISMFSSRSVPYVPRQNKLRDGVYFVYCSLIAFVLVGVLAISAFASLVAFWPYNMSISLANYNFDIMDGGGWGAYYNSIVMSFGVAIFGTVFIFITAYLVEKIRSFPVLRASIQLLALLPMAVPGLVLGLSYIFFFNAPGNPLHFLYGSMAILVISSIVHYYSVGYLTSIAALKQIDPEYESVGASLKVPMYKTFFRVSMPLCLPAIFDVSTYLFMTAMTTVSAVIFLYSPRTQLASIAVINMEGAGDVAPAAAMAMIIVLTTASIRILHWGLTRKISARLLAWSGQK